MKTRTLGIDGSYLLKRSFNGAKDVYTSSFGHIGGLYQFMTTTRKLIKEHLINKVIVFWDGENGGFGRYLIDHNYKANRKNKEWHQKIELTEAQIKHEKEKDESLLIQKKRIQSYLEELFVRQIEIDKIEADDLIAEYCIRHHNDEEIFIFTNDRDFSQLLDLNITIIFGNIPQPITKINYIMHFNHYYQNALIIKVIIGDTSDNIQGIKGINENTLLKYFPELKFKKLTVREICEKASNINTGRIKNKKKPLKIFENLLNNVDRLKLNYELINLRKPFLNEKAKDELEQLEIPLSPEGRSSKNLYKMMIEDEFLGVYGSTFVNYVEPYYTVIMNEKQTLNEYYKSVKK
jgi:5'-3' exonuclease